jgi:hypothetical protein
VRQVRRARSPHRRAAKLEKATAEGKPDRETMAVDMQVTDLQKKIIDDAYALRGKIITAYSQVEFLLADISVKLDLKFPYRIKQRINAVKKIALRRGYEKYQNELEKVCDELLQYDELRTFMAHGFLTLTTNAQDNHKLEYRMYQHDGEGKFNLISIEITVPLLQHAERQITQYVSDTVQLFSRIYAEQGLEGGLAGTSQ